MILPDMTCQQIKDVLEADSALVLREDNFFVARGGFKPARLPHAKYPMTIVHSWVSPKTHQKYLLMDVIPSRNAAFCITPYQVQSKAVITTQNGYEVILSVYDKPESNKIDILHFKPHFFARYKERMHLNFDGEDVVRFFAKRNIMFTQMDEYRRSEGNTQDVMFSCYDGACFGSIDPDDNSRFIIKTFVANETMQEGYKSKFNKEYDEGITESINDAMEKGRIDIAYQVASSVKYRKSGKVKNHLKKENQI